MSGPAAVPAGPHTPVTNTVHESELETPQLVELPSAGGVGDEPGPVKDGSEDVPRREMVEEAMAESVWHVPDTGGLLDVGAASFGAPGPILETVHGPDNRVRIINTATYPWRAHASLLITARDGSRWLGTGWFISPRTLITAGHCVCIKGSGDSNRDGWVKNIQVMPGRDGNTAPFGAATSTTFWSVKGWVDSGDENYDYGAIILPSELGKTVGWFGFGVFDDDMLRHSVANISGYPGDQPAGTQWYDSHEVASVNPSKVFYDVDTAGGQSGAAVYMIEDGKRIAVAIHAYGGATTNSGTRISAPAFANLKTWKSL
jgi:glutamyl endopeptidase